VIVGRTPCIFFKFKRAMKKETIEGKTAETLLQSDEAIEIGGKRYDVAPQTTGTLVLASAIIAELPSSKGVSGDEVLGFVLNSAKEYGKVGEVLAVLVVGAKRLKCGSWFSRLFWRWRCRQLAGRFLNEVGTDELIRAFVEVLGRMRGSDFFGLTTFLQEIKTTTPTREVVS